MKVYQATTTIAAAPVSAHPDALDVAGAERPLAVHSVIGEEDGGLGAFATLRRGHRGDAAVITEPTGAKLITACRW